MLIVAAGKTLINGYVIIECSEVREDSLIFTTYASQCPLAVSICDIIEGKSFGIVCNNDLYEGLVNWMVVNQETTDDDPAEERPLPKEHQIIEVDFGKRAA